MEPAGDDTIAGRIATSLGYSRVPASPGSFAVWLRELPLRPGRPDVLLFDGRTKANQTAHHSVIDIDVGRRDLQQCADAVIRLRAEYLYSRGCEDTISFRFTSGDPAKFADWRAGLRPRVDGNRVTWAQSGRVGGEWRDLRSYLDVVFTYAGSYSLERELAKVSDPSSVQPGDVFIQGGFPGHAVIVVDVARNDAGQRQMLLAQSYMPAQQIHVLQNPSRPDSPWYDASSEGVLLTPEWRFASGDLRRFPDIPACPTDLQAP